MTDLQSLETGERSGLDFDRQIARAAQQAAGDVRRTRNRTAHTGRSRRARDRQRRGRALVFCMTLLSLLAVLTVMNLTGRGPFGVSVKGQRPPLLGELIEDLHFEFQEIEDYRAEYRALPPALPSLGHWGQDDGWLYEPIGLDDYRLSLTDHGLTVAYDSRQPPRSVFGDLAAEE